MKNEVNRSFMDKKKNYNQPNVELVQLMPTTMILAGSPNVDNHGQQGIDPD